MKKSQPDFSEAYELFDYSYDFLEEYFHVRPTLYKGNREKVINTRKGQSKNYIIEHNVYYGVKGSTGSYNMYGRSIAPYVVRVVERRTDMVIDISIMLHFYSIDDASMNVHFSVDREKTIEYFMDGIWEYLDSYSQLQSPQVFEYYFKNLCSDARFDYN